MMHYMMVLKIIGGSTPSYIHVLLLLLFHYEPLGKACVSTSQTSRSWLLLAVLHMNSQKE